MAEDKKVEEARKRAEGTISFGVSAFPINQWKEWDMDCKKNFGDCRWIKMWHDHVRSKDYDFYAEVLERIRALENKASDKPKEEPNVVKTFTKKLKN